MGTVTTFVLHSKSVDIAKGYVSTDSIRCKYVSAFIYSAIFCKISPKNTLMNKFVERTDVRPVILYLVSHPEDTTARRIGDLLNQHFNSDRYKKVTSGANVNVQFVRILDNVLLCPKPIDWNLANTTAVVVLIGEKFVADKIWMEYFCNLVSQAESLGFKTRVFPVAIVEQILKNLNLELQALKWYEWEGDTETRSQQLIRELMYEISRMLRYFLEKTQLVSDGKETRVAYGRNIKIFLSYSKHDKHGQTVAMQIRDWIKENSQLSSFLDIDDIPAGVQFSNFISDNIEDSVMLAIYTDSYSSRTWCQREVIEAKRSDNPILIVNCMNKMDERVFPYIGNVPAIRVDPKNMNNIEDVIPMLLEEIFKHYLWNSRVYELRKLYPDVLFISRLPELITFAMLPTQSKESELTVVYPEPPIGSEESQLIVNVWQNVQLSSLADWLQE